jgi:hypothetical protein
MAMQMCESADMRTFLWTSGAATVHATSEAKAAMTYASAIPRFRDSIMAKVNFARARLALIRRASLSFSRTLCDLWQDIEGLPRLIGATAVKAWPPAHITSLPSHVQSIIAIFAVPGT